MNIKNKVLIGLLLLWTYLPSYGQCPSNINFETGYTGWNYYTGSVATVSSVYTWTWGAPTTTPSDAVLTPGGTGTSDPYGGFSTVAPDGGGHSLRLNGQFTGNMASKAEYVFTPAMYGITNMTFWYAVVLQDPGHPANVEPRFTVTVLDLTTHAVLTCANFTYVSGSFAGTAFVNSHVVTSDGNADAWYLPWQSANIDLSTVPPGHAVSISFAAGDCTAGGHWGYAYIDMDCSPWMANTTVSACYPGYVTLPSAPPGFASYTWYVSGVWGSPIGTGASLPAFPTPGATTTYAVIGHPYPGFGCPETLYVKVTHYVPPTAHISGSATICSGGGGNITVTGTPNAVVTYSGESSGSGTGSVTLSPGGTGIIPYTGTTGSSPSTFTVSLTGVTFPSTSSSTACPGTATGSYAVTVNPLPDAGVISGPTFVCDFSKIILSESVSGGTWSSSDTSAASVDSTGLVTSLEAGSYIISYTVTNACGTDVATYPVTIGAIADPGVITGPDDIEVSHTGSLSETVSGGTWLTGDASIATVSSSGVVTGVAAGSTWIYYSIPYSPAFPCGTDSAWFEVYIYAPKHSNPANDSANTELLSNVRLIPNPNKGIFTITGALTVASKTDQVQLEIVNILGQAVYTDYADVSNGSINKKIIMSDATPNGNYTIRIKTNNNTQNIRFTLSR